MLIPALVSRGRGGYVSLDRCPVAGVDDSHIADASETPPILVRQLATTPSSTLREIPLLSLLEIFRRAGEIFLEGEPDGQAPDDFIRNVSLNSGLPLMVSSASTLGLFPENLCRMDRFLAAQSPAGLEVFDRNIFEAGGTRIGFVPRGRSVGFVMPGNHPSTHFAWLGALAMKVPVVIRPSVDDMFTPYRLVCSLLEAGLPEDAIAFVPGGHDLVDCIVDACSLSVLFGGQQIVNRYGSNPRVKIHGPGRSKVIVLRNADFDQTVSLIARLVMDNAGRGCLNVSSVIVEDSASAMAAAVAKVLSDIAIEPPLVKHAQLGATRRPVADMISAMIEGSLTCGARQLTPASTDRVVTVDGFSVLRPCAIEVATFEHPLFGVELPFPFVVFASACRQDLIQVAKDSLAVVLAGNDQDVLRGLLFEPSIAKVLGDSSIGADFDPVEPHEGFLLDFLYQKKALRV